MKKETNWQQELRNREIKPSEDAWNKISGGLHQKQLKHNRKKFVVWIAAACVCGMLLYPFVFSEATKEVATPLVTTPLTKEVNTHKDSFESQGLHTPSIEVRTSIKEENSTTIVATTSISGTLHKTDHKNSHIPTPKATKEVATNNGTPTDYLLEVESYLQKVEVTVASQIASTEERARALLLEMEQEVPSFSDEEKEMNRLLAQVDIQLNSVSKEQLVNFARAQNLLADAEASLEKEDLKRKIWQFIKTNYQNLETTLVSLK